jgi:hypothetical protein
MQLFIFLSEFQPEVEFLKDHVSSHLFLPIGKADKFQWRRFYQNSSKNHTTKSNFLWNSSRILIRTLVGNFSGKYIRWLWNSSRSSIRIVDRNAANPIDDCVIPLEF